MGAARRFSGWNRDQRASPELLGLITGSAYAGENVLWAVERQRRKRCVRGLKAISQSCYVDCSHLLSSGLGGQSAEQRRSEPEALCSPNKQDVNVLGPSLGFKMVTRTKKIFVGGLSANTVVEDVKQYFEQFGKFSKSLETAAAVEALEEQTCQPGDVRLRELLGTKGINGGKNKCVRQLGRSFLVISGLGGALWGVMHRCLMASKQKRCLLVCPHSCGWPEDGPGAAGELGAAWDVQSVFGFNSALLQIFFGTLSKSLNSSLPLFPNCKIWLKCRCLCSSKVLEMRALEIMKY
nr:RNA-binding protein Musashi homolog 2 isoform X13 [Columba livia]